jgi:GNAT superfamily N-acetyltransferase
MDITSLKYSSFIVKMSSNLNYKYLPFSSVLFKERSSTERLWNTLRLIEPNLEDAMPPVIEMREKMRGGSIRNPDKLIQILFLSGIYALYDGETLLSVATIQCNKIDRIITLPRFRRNGYASMLVKHIAEKMKECGICVICPVEAHAEPLFRKLGWVKDTKMCPDGCYDFHLPEHTREYRQMVQGTFGYDFSTFTEHLSEIMAEV